MRDQTKKCVCGKPGIRFDLAPFDRDERLIETERILSLLMESRSDGEHTYLYLQDEYCTEWITDEVVYDLLPCGLFPFIAEARNTDLVGARNNGIGSQVCSPNFAAPTPSHLRPFSDNPCARVAVIGTTS